MDFLDPKKKRAHSIRLFVGYFLVGIAIIISTFILVLATSGYGFDRKTGQVIQNGLVFIDSNPVSARININGEDRGTTDRRYVLEEGDYSITLSRDGYRDWSRDITVSGGSIVRLVYPFLFPAELVRRDVHIITSDLDIASQSPDRKWVVLHTPAAPKNFVLIDTSTKENAATLLSIPDEVLPSQPNQKVEVVEWSTDNVHMLLKVTSDTGVQFVVFNRDSPSESINITTVLGGGFDKMILRDKRYDKYYAYTASGLLQSADLQTKILTVVSNHVVDFWPHGDDTILYLRNDATTGLVDVLMMQDEVEYKIRTLPNGDSYVLDIADYDGDRYVAVGSTADSRAYLYKNPIDKLKHSPEEPPQPFASLKVDSPARSLTFSTNARFVALQGGSSFALYDFERNRQYRYDSGLVPDEGGRATWMDGHRLAVINSGALHVFDFDGTNAQELVPADPRFRPFFSGDYKSLFTVSPALSRQDTSALVRTELIVQE